MKFSFKIYSKSNLYGRMLLFILFIGIVILLSSESSFILGDEVIGPKIGGTIASLLIVGMFLYTIQLLAVFGLTGKNLNKLFYGILVLYAFIGIYIANPFVTVLSYEGKQLFYPIAHFFNLIIFSSISVFILRDIFKSSKTHADHIWGALVVYFFIIFSFSEIYEILSILNPGMLGESYEIGWPNYIQCFIFSMNAISGMDLAYPGVHDLLRKIAIFENIIGNLFLIVILGRLLSHPLEKDNKNQPKAHN